MKVHDYRLPFVAVVGILTLLLASPALSRLLVYPRTEFFTEFWILDSNHRADNYPFNITRNENYPVFLGIANHLGYNGYYVVEVKFRNLTQSTPSSLNRTPSSLPSLFNITVFVADEGSWELPLLLSFDFESGQMPLQIKFNNFKLNDSVLDMSNLIISWDLEKNGFFGSLFFELWIYNMTTSKFQYHERFVRLWLNMTA